MRWGVEHEYAVWGRAGRVDFRVLLAALELSCFDPGDPRARRLPSGVALTADGWEAELATPPLSVHLGATLPEEMLRRERAVLRDVVRGSGALRLEGFSTHLNVTVPDDLVVPLSRDFLACVPAVAAVLEPVASAGVLVRPRRGRLEVGGEYADGATLGVALTLVAACTAALLAGEQVPSVPPAAECSREKFGWFVPADAMRGDPRRSLGQTWSWARPFAAGLGIDPAPVDALVAGAPLRRELDRPPGEVDYSAVPSLVTPDLAPRRRPGGWVVETRWATWHHVVWEARDRTGRRVYVVLPADEERDFLDALDQGRHDRALRRFARRWPRRTLLLHEDVGDGGWWHRIRPEALVASERAHDGAVPSTSRRRARQDLRNGATAPGSS